MPAAGITDFIFVTAKGKSALEDYFDCSNELEAKLANAQVIDPKLVDAVTAAMRQGLNQYPPMPGIPALREAGVIELARYVEGTATYLGKAVYQICPDQDRVKAFLAAICQPKRGRATSMPSGVVRYSTCRFVMTDACAVLHARTSAVPSSCPGV